MAKQSLAKQVEVLRDKIKNARSFAEEIVANAIRQLESDTGLTVQEVRYTKDEWVIIIFDCDSPDFDPPEPEEDEE